MIKIKIKPVAKPRQTEKALQQQCEGLLNAYCMPYLHLNTWAMCYKCKTYHPIDKNKGYPDLDIKTKAGNLMVELKAKSGKLDSEQKLFKELMYRIG